MLLPACLALLLSGVVVGSHLWVDRLAAGRCQDEMSALPEIKTALVLGCAPTLDGRPNLFFTRRIDAAARLFYAGKVSDILVSGDNGSRRYDETTAMKEALVKAGVPASRIHADYAGFRTLDSVVRAREVFGQERLIVVSQRFHNERAVFLALRHGIEAYAYNAADVTGAGGARMQAREWLARLRAVLDVTLLRTRPKFLGEPVRIP